ncbi:serine/threonine protein kinase [Cystobacter fuscus]|uniref:serine/threonine-protein kinase n=1 Tax=Cystobacter fuscus TaxID=43 RepID=UPI002B2C0723|nr:serine/threonine protein kinase [Cystobacter fuscus]
MSSAHERGRRGGAPGGWQRRYRVLEERGPACLMAEDTRLRRRVVIRLRERARERGPSRSVREAQVLERAARNNPNVPRVLDRWFEGEREFLVLEHITGTPLSELLRAGSTQGKPYFAPEESHRMVLGLARGLFALHRNGICHGDLKPANLVVTRNNRLAMIDFGSAWSGPLRRGTRDRGTMGYAAPEQWREEALVDERADQFSVSAILYQMLTNELPWEGLGGTVVEACAGAVPPLTLPSAHAVARGRARFFWAALDPVVERGLRVDKDARFETTQAWLRALGEAASDRRQRRADEMVAGAIGEFVARLFSRWRKK